MGSSKTGSLDKFASFSPAAAFASGKVKLPETGLIGMMQQNQEDKMAMNAANIAAQQPSQQQNQYNQMLQQMMMNQQKPSPYSPAPYANGGNVTLRRKMFKLGGSASAHGTGLTSGLEFNQGGRVGLRSGGDPIDAMFEKASTGAKKFGKRGEAVGFGLDALRRLFGLGKPRGKKFTSDIADMIRGPRTAADAGLLMRALGKPTARGLRAAGLGTGVLSIPGALSAAADGLLPGDFADTEQEAKGSGAERALRALRIASEAGLDYSPFGFGYEAIDYLTRDPDLTAGRDLSDVIAGREAKLTGDGALAGGREIEDDISSSDLAERIATQDAERMREAMEMYQELIRGEDNTNKLATLGDALIAGGSSLLEGEGYGAAASAFNEPLSQARVGQEAADAEARAAAAQLAIGEDISRRQIDKELSMNLLAAGDLTTEEEIQAVLTARSVGISQRLPEDDKGEVDEDALKSRGVGVYVDPRQRYGKLFVAVNSQGINNPDGVIYTNDPEKAKQHAKS